MRYLRLIIFFCALWMCHISLPTVAWALDIKAIRFGIHEDKRRIVVEASDLVSFHSFVMDSPTRIIIDTKNFSWKSAIISRDKTKLIKDVRLGETTKNTGRIVIETSKPVKIISSFSIPANRATPNKIVIDFQIIEQTGQSNNKAAVQNHLTLLPSEKPLQQQSLGTLLIPGHKPTTHTNLQSETSLNVTNSLSGQKLENKANKSPQSPNTSKIRLEKPIIIIDPGHGGQDPGAIGANGMYEKTITLAVGLELRKQLESTGRYRVRMTRDSDFFVPLGSRVKYARRQKGDLFISLHADSIRNSSVTGASVYTLSDKASDKETAKLAERENKSDLIAGVDLSNQEEDVAGILIDLAARDTMNQSRFLARTVLNTFDTHGIKIIDRSQKSAGFAVLKAMDIPSVLIEMGYLTNINEVRKLSSPQHRQLIAGNIVRSVEYFFQKTSQ